MSLWVGALVCSFNYSIMAHQQSLGESFVVNEEENEENSVGRWKCNSSNHVYCFCYSYGMGWFLFAHLHETCLVTERMMVLPQRKKRKFID